MQGNFLREELSGYDFKGSGVIIKLSDVDHHVRAIGEFVFGPGGVAQGPRVLQPIIIIFLIIKNIFSSVS